MAGVAHNKGQQASSRTGSQSGKTAMQAGQEGEQGTVTKQGKRRLVGSLGRQAGGQGGAGQKCTQHRQPRQGK
jgi:hypothetical protein